MASVPPRRPDTARPAAPPRFELLAEDGGARAGILHVGGRKVPTPVFMPVGTQAVVKTLTCEDIEALDYELILANTYHLMLRPGGDYFEAYGGLHRFWSWPGAILTDSGGFQVFSLDHLTRTKEEGVQFRSHLDGTRFFLRPEDSAKLQCQFGSDIVMAFDECLPWPLTEREAKRRTARSLRWTTRSHAAFQELRAPHQGFWGICQGGGYDDLRRGSVAGLLELDCDGYAIGGLAIGEPKEVMREQTAVACDVLPREKARYLMGVGTPVDLVESVALGVDMFDCVMPTRAARHDHVYTMNEGRLNLRNACHRADERPIEDGCPCPGCGRYSRAYLHHLAKTRENTVKRLSTLHNLTHYRRLMRDMRSAILEGTFEAFRSRVLETGGGL